MLPITTSTTTAPIPDDLATDEELIRRVLDGDISLYAGLMRRHNQRLYRAARAIVKDEDEVEDVMQEAYVRAFTHLKEFDGRARFSTWLTRIAVHEALARLRKKRRHDSIEAMEESADFSSRGELMEPNNRTPELDVRDRELGAILEEAIDGLPETFRTVFVLRAVEEMSTTETAECLDIPEDTVKTRLHRARNLLQKQLLERIEARTSRAFDFQVARCSRVVMRVLRRITWG
jgi:RNA polymerase sigma-70 factor (ECF subfamily)